MVLAATDSDIEIASIAGEAGLTKIAASIARRRRGRLSVASRDGITSGMTAAASPG